jgi:hypothetical protein
MPSGKPRQVAGSYKQETGPSRPGSIEDPHLPNNRFGYPTSLRSSRNVTHYYVLCLASPDAGSVRQTAPLCVKWILVWDW